MDDLYYSIVVNAMSIIFVDRVNSVQILGSGVSVRGVGGLERSVLPLISQ
jgi:hypothetical protein